MSKGLFGKSLFRYDETTDTYACPGAHQLRPAYFHDLPGGKRIQYTNRDACRSCPLRSRCTTDTHRRISRYANEAVMDRMAERLSAQPTLLDGGNPRSTIKQWIGARNLPDAAPEQRPRRVQPDGARLQHPTGDQSRRRPDSDHCGNYLTPGRAFPAICQTALGSLAKTHKRKIVTRNSKRSRPADYRLSSLRAVSTEEGARLTSPQFPHGLHQELTPLRHETAPSGRERGNLTTHRGQTPVRPVSEPSPLLLRGLGCPACQAVRSLRTEIRHPPFNQLVPKVMDHEPYRSAPRVFWIVDNGSSHRGRASIERLQGQWPNIKVVHRPIHVSIVQRKVLTPE